MIKETIIIQNPTGLHTRPAKRVVAEAKKFMCTITITRGEKAADLKSLIKLMKLGISQNHSVEISCEGDDEAAAMEHLKNYILSLED